MKQIDYSRGSISGNIMKASLPMLIAQILNLLYSIVDRIYIARIAKVGTVAIGGVGLCFSIIIMVAAFTNLYGMGGAPLCSMARGSGDHDRAENVMNTAYFLLFYTSFILIILFELFAKPLLILFGASENNIVFALPYLRIYLLGTTFSMITTGLNPYINAQGFPSTGMLTVVIGAVANIILDPVFIFALKLGVSGAAIATVLSQILSSIFVLYFLHGNDAELQLHLPSFSEFREHLKTAKDIVVLGLSSFVMQFTNGAVNIACNSVLSRFGGDIYISIMTILMSVRQILETPLFAVAEGSSPIISFNYGARNSIRARKTLLLMSAMAVIYTLMIWAFIEAKPLWLLYIFTSDSALHKAALPAMHIYFIGFVFQALQVCGQTTFKSLGKKKRAIFFSIFRKLIIVVPLTFLLPGVFHQGVMGVFQAEPLSNLIGGLACYTTMLLTILPELKTMDKEVEHL